MRTVELSDEERAEAVLALTMHYAQMRAFADTPAYPWVMPRVMATYRALLRLAGLPTPTEATE